MKCPKCQSQIDNDSKYCENCGTKILSNKEMKKRKIFYNRNYEENENTDKGRKLFIVAFFGLDLILSTIIGFLQIPNIWVFMMSGVIYIVSIYYCFKGGKFAFYLKKQDKPMSGLGTSITVGLSSLLMIVMNASQILPML